MTQELHSQTQNSRLQQLEQSWRLPLITTKLAPHHQASTLVQRPKLVEALKRGSERRLTLVTAPAGFGKSTLLAQWRAHVEADGFPVAWLSLDPDDDDPLQFLSYLLAAIDASNPGSVSKAKALLDMGNAVPDRTVVAALINQINALGQEICLVLDDLQHLHSPGVLDLLKYLVFYAPANLHFIFASQSTVDLMQARLRADGQLVEITASRLKFDFAETCEFLRYALNVQLDDQQIQKLHDTSEGWAVGLKIATLSIQGLAQQPLALDPSLGETAAMKNYLSESILSYVPKETRDFLLRTSILDRLTPAVCEAITGVDMTNTLQQLGETSPLFLVALDAEGKWFRYHHLVAKSLKTILADEIEPEELAELHHKAYVWFASNGLWADAVRHALASGDMRELADGLERCAMSLVMRSDVRTLLSWVNRLPEHYIQQRAMLCIATAWGLAHTQKLEEAERFLTIVESRASESDATEFKALQNQVLAVRTTIAIFEDDTVRAVALAEGYRLDAPCQDLLVNWAVRNILAFGHLVAGRFENARLVLSHKEQRTPRSDGNLFSEAYRTSLLGESYSMQARLCQAIKLYREAIEYFESQSGRQSVAAVLVASMLADLLYERNELDKIPPLFADRMDLVDESCALDAVMRAYLSLAKVKVHQNEVDDARELLIWAELIGKDRGWYRLMTACAAERLKLSIAEKRLIEAKQILAYISDILPARPDLSHFSFAEAEQMKESAQIEWLLANGEPGLAVQKLQEQLVMAEASGRIYQTAKISIRLAIALHGVGQVDQALHHLGTALRIGETGGMMRSFLDAGPSMSVLLGRFLSSLPDQSATSLAAYVKSILACCVQERSDSEQVQPTLVTSGPKPDVLSARERDILSLVAKYHSNKEIAKTLSISTETVKWHLKNIYGKLAAFNRRDAVRKGCGDL